MVDHRTCQWRDREDPLLQEVLSAHDLTRFDWALLDGLRWCVDDALESGRFIAKNASLEDGYHYNMFIGEWADADVVETVTEFLKKGYYTRVSKQMAEDVVRERLESEGCEDVSVDDLVGNYVLTECGLAVWTSVSLGLSGEPFAQFMSQPDVRWIFRGAIPFTMIDVCTAKRENPKWSICADLNCKLEKIGPWEDPGNCVMPSGWRLTCFRRYVDESKYKANKTVE